MTVPHSRTLRRPRRIKLRPKRCCLFCGAFDVDSRLIARLDQRVCEECFKRIGRLFSARQYTPLMVRAEICILCHRTADARLLVAGVAAAICRSCYLRIKRDMRAKPFALSDDRLRQEQARDLTRSRDVRMRARKRYEQLYKEGHSLRRPYPPMESIGLALEAAIAFRNMQPPLALVTSRDRVKGHPALKIRSRAAFMRVLLGRRTR